MRLIEYTPDAVRLLFVFRNPYPVPASRTTGWDTRHGYKFSQLRALFGGSSHNPYLGAWYASRDANGGWKVTPADRVPLPAANGITDIVVATLALQGERVGWSNVKGFAQPIGTMGLSQPDFAVGLQFADGAYRVVDVGGARLDGARYVMLWDDVAGKAFTQTNPDEPAQTFTGHEHHPLGAFRLDRASASALLPTLELDAGAPD